MCWCLAAVAQTLCHCDGAGFVWFMTTAKCILALSLQSYKMSMRYAKFLGTTGTQAYKCVSMLACPVAAAKLQYSTLAPVLPIHQSAHSAAPVSMLSLQSSDFGCHSSIW